VSNVRPDDATVAELVRLERALADRDPTGIPDGLASLLDDDFLEFGSSGRIWSRDATITVLLPAKAGVPVTIRDVDARVLTDDLVLLLYRIEVTTSSGGRASRRSSIWRRHGTGWRIAFHQGTPIPDQAVVGSG
jgi:hypothetical protein